MGSLPARRSSLPCRIKSSTSAGLAAWARAVAGASQADSSSAGSRRSIRCAGKESHGSGRPSYVATLLDQVQRQGLPRCSSPIGRYHRPSPGETSTQNRLDHPTVSHVRPANSPQITILLATRNQRFVLPRRVVATSPVRNCATGAVLRFLLCFPGIRANLRDGAGRLVTRIRLSRGCLRHQAAGVDRTATSMHTRPDRTPAFGVALVAVQLGQRGYVLTTSDPTLQVRAEEAAGVAAAWHAGTGGQPSDGTGGSGAGGSAVATGVSGAGHGRAAGGSAGTGVTVAVSGASRRRRVPDAPAGSDSPAPPPSDSGPSQPPGKCSATPGPNAACCKLAFKPLRSPAT